MLHLLGVKLKKPKKHINVVSTFKVCTPSENNVMGTKMILLFLLLITIISSYLNCCRRFKLLNFRSLVIL